MCTSLTADFVSLLWSIQVCANTIPHSLQDWVLHLQKNKSRNQWSTHGNKVASYLLNLVSHVTGATFLRLPNLQPSLLLNSYIYLDFWNRLNTAVGSALQQARWFTLIPVKKEIQNSNRSVFTCYSKGRISEQTFCARAQITPKNQPPLADFFCVTHSLHKHPL